MKYLCLVYLEAEKMRAVPDAECMACGNGLRESGMLVAAEALQPIETATTVRVRGGRATITFDVALLQLRADQLRGLRLCSLRR